jgi:hypothetical protein
MSKLAAAHQSVNLGQGYPDEEGPDAMKRAAADALFSHHNQYPPMMGVPELRQAVAAHSAREAGVPCDWARETLVTVGATEGIAAAFMGLCNPGDEVRAAGGRGPGKPVGPAGCGVAAGLWGGVCNSELTAGRGVPGQHQARRLPLAQVHVYTSLRACRVGPALQFLSFDATFRSLSSSRCMTHMWACASRSAPNW